MESQPNQPPVSHERARAIITRLLAESRENLRQMEESFATDPAIQETLAELRKMREQKAKKESSNGSL